MLLFSKCLFSKGKHFLTYLSQKESSSKNMNLTLGLETMIRGAPLVITVDWSSNYHILATLWAQLWLITFILGNFPILESPDLSHLPCLSHLNCNKAEIHCHDTKGNDQKPIGPNRKLINPHGWYFCSLWTWKCTGFFSCIVILVRSPTMTMWSTLKIPGNTTAPTANTKCMGNLTVLTNWMGVWAVPVPVSSGLVCQAASCQSFGHCKISVWDSVIQEETYQEGPFLYSCNTCVGVWKKQHLPFIIGQMKQKIRLRHVPQCWMDGLAERAVAFRAKPLVTSLLMWS